MSSLKVLHCPVAAAYCADIGGLEDIILSVKETVIYPLVYPDLFRSASYDPL